jgi:alkylation response protein AidB-like acyl-CoA dehydrogenase
VRRPGLGSEALLDRIVGQFFAEHVFGPGRAALLAAQLPATDADAAAERDAAAAKIQARIRRIEAAQNSQIYEGTNQIQRMVMARQLLKG